MTRVDQESTPVTTVGARIRRERQLRGLTIARLGELAGMSPRTVGRIERGETSGEASITKLLAALGPFIAEPADPVTPADRSADGPHRRLGLRRPIGGTAPRLDTATVAQLWMRLVELCAARSGGAAAPLAVLGPRRHGAYSRPRRAARRGRAAARRSAKIVPDRTVVARPVRH